MHALTLKLNTLAMTRDAGLALGHTLPPRGIVLLSGEMGAGKTTLAKGICEAIGIRPETVISPTYTMVNVYPGQRSVYHVDLFRLETPEGLLEMDRDDWVNPEGLTLIEWPEMARPLLVGEPVLEVALEVPIDRQAKSADKADPVESAGHMREVREMFLKSAGEAYAPVFAALRVL